jgi:hypothetical protein
MADHATKVAFGLPDVSDLPLAQTSNIDDMAMEAALARLLPPVSELDGTPCDGTGGRMWQNYKIAP